MKPVQTVLAIGVLLTISLAALSFLDGCSELPKPIPINPTKDFPCGTSGYYTECPGGGCCLSASEFCGKKGRACDETMCCFAPEGPLWGSLPDAGAGRKQTTPDEARSRR